MVDDNTYWWDGEPCLFCGSYRCEGDCPEAYDAMVEEMIDDVVRDDLDNYIKPEAMK